MPPPRVLVSSTAYDLSHLRGLLERFISDHGFDPVLSDQSDVFYDPGLHTHDACISEVRKCDMLILIVGGRLGSQLEGKQFEKFSEGLDYSVLSRADPGARVSITQAETITAVREGIPVFTYVEANVNNDYRLFRANRGDTDLAMKINYPSIPKAESAEYIFSFLDFLRGRHVNNSVIPFEKFDDISGHLSKQWAAMFQNLLSESRKKRDEQVRADIVAEQIKDLKTALLTLVGTERRQVARAVVRFRRLVAFLNSLPNTGTLVRDAVVQGDFSWEQLLRETASVTSVESAESRYGPSWQSVLTRDSLGSVLCKLSVDAIDAFQNEWLEFVRLDETSREAVYGELVDSMPQSEIGLVELAPEPTNWEPLTQPAKLNSWISRRREVDIVLPEPKFLEPGDKA